MLWSPNVFYYRPVYYYYRRKKSCLFDQLKIRKIDVSLTSIYFFSKVLILSRFFSPYLLDFLQFRYAIPIREGFFGFGFGFGLDFGIYHGWFFFQLPRPMFLCLLLILARFWPLLFQIFLLFYFLSSLSDSNCMLYFYLLLHTSIFFHSSWMFCLVFLFLCFSVCHFILLSLCISGW